MITTEDLRFIQVVASHRTLSDVARSLNITPPSVTLRLQNIEKKLSITIIQRPSRTVSLTEEGQLLLDKGASILHHLDELQELLDENKTEVSGKLRVLAPLGFGNDYVTPLLAEYKTMHPKLEVELELSDNPTWSHHHKWDIIIFIGKLPNSTLRMVTLAKNQRFLCASPEYLKTKGSPEAPQDLRSHQCIALRENNEDVTLWTFTDPKNGKEETVRIDPAMASNEGRVVKDWGIAGMGIIMRSEWDVQPQLNSGQLERVLPNYQLPNADIIALLSTHRSERSGRTSGFLALLKERLSCAPWNNESGG
ncbi:LysR family transcriptional regulator [Vibrio nigripulchritudo ATCC 27043]|uniref:LysR substrate-binding domain-containing protein n=1 Tax=Vibrio nigripulchritudo TaxID=28173 RepID=UPI00021C1B94|nr:LysR substrate-binding domain-containing protein [Vibrio nigripulchritudo]EGU60491.1 LysR family transcriptional regulator [Vibrio nigripulchritudo ATCC 27043]